MWIISCVQVQTGIASSKQLERYSNIYEDLARCSKSTRRITRIIRDHLIFLSSKKCCNDGNRAVSNSMGCEKDL